MENLTSSIHPDYSFFASGKWLYYPERVNCVQQGNFRGVTPVTAQLIPSLYCNFRCPHCCYGRSKEDIRVRGDRQAMLMTLETMLTVIDRLCEAGIRGVVFSGGGEPTCAPHLLDGMRYAVQKGLKIGLFTNGSLLTGAEIHQLLELEPTFIRVSLDAVTPILHRLIHGYAEQHNYLPRVLENIERLAKEKLLQKVNTTIGVGVTVEPINLGDLTEVAKCLREIASHAPLGGIDYLVFRPTVNYQGGKYAQSAQPLLDYVEEHAPEYHAAYQSYINQWEQLPAQLFEAANQVISKEVIPLLNGTGIQVINIRTKMLGITQTQRPFRMCRASPWYIFVGPDGTVYNCVDLGLDPRVAIGNLLSQSLNEIWKSERRQAVLDFIDQEGLQTLCPPVCLYYELNCLFENLDAALQSANGQRRAALEWIAAQEVHVQAEMTSGVYSQPHREFI
jgi:radical SAM protein with 4Fe4S-binding SPASM domain